MGRIGESSAPESRTIEAYDPGQFTFLRNAPQNTHVSVGKGEDYRVLKFLHLTPSVKTGTANHDLNNLKHVVTCIAHYPM